MLFRRCYDDCEKHGKSHTLFWIKSTFTTALMFVTKNAATRGIHQAEIIFTVARLQSWSRANTRDSTGWRENCLGEALLMSIFFPVGGDSRHRVPARTSTRLWHCMSCPISTSSTMCTQLRPRNISFRLARKQPTRNYTLPNKFVIAPAWTLYLGHSSKPDEGMPLALRAFYRAFASEGS